MMQMEERKVIPHGLTGSTGQHQTSMPANGTTSQQKQTMDTNGSSHMHGHNNGGVQKNMGENNAQRDMGYYQAMHAYQHAHGGGIGTRRQTPCPVCMSPTVPPNMVLEPCQHQFHYQCIEVFIQNDKSCPVCRVQIQRHQPLGRPAMQTGNPHGMQPDYTGHPMSNMNYQQTNSMHMNSNMAPTQHGNQSSGLGHFASASVYELPPEVFLDNSYEQNTTMNAAKMRKGKWTTEEAAYCDRLIEEFKNGNLPLAEGTTLRTFLSKLLNCDPMRISKKYTGNQCIGKIIFRRKSKEPTKDEIEGTRKQLAELERIYLERERMNQQRREKRLESEVNRDRTRLLAARNIVYAGTPQQNAPPPTNSYNSSQSNPSMLGNNSYSQQQSESHPPSQQNHHMHHSTHHTTTMHPPPTTMQHPPPTTKPPTAPLKEMDHGHLNGGIKVEKESEFPRISSVDSFASFFPRIASLECFSNLQSISSRQNDTKPPAVPTPSMYRSPSLECLNSMIPRVNSLEQFSNFIANMPQEPKKTTTSPKTSQTISKPPMDKPFPRVASLDRLHLPRPPSTDRLPRINSTEAFLNHVPSLGNLSAFGSFNNLGSLNKEIKGNISRNSSIEDILSLVAASSESETNKKRKLEENSLNEKKKSHCL